MSEHPHRASFITASGAIIAAVTGAAAVIYVRESRKPGRPRPETSGTGIYLRVRNENQAAIAARIKPEPEAAGYNVPAVRRVDNGLNRAKVKYFRNDDEEGADALVKLPHARGVKDAEKVLVGGLRDRPAPL